METAPRATLDTGAVFADRLLDRRQRLEEARQQLPGAAELDRLLQEVDLALGRLEAGTFGLCEVCHDTIETDRLLADPLLRTCVDHMSAGERRDLERDLATAARVQEALLPRRDLVVAGWEMDYAYAPLGPVSGDYLDLVPTVGGGFHLGFGDISGKGVAASLLMSHLHATFRGLLPSGAPPTEILGAANRLFCESTLSQHFATVVCGRADGGGRIELANAGHLQPLLLGRDGVEALPAQGLPIGLFCDTTYHSLEVELGPGDTLLLYTDGLAEATNGAGEEYGTERVEALAATQVGASAGALVAACLEDLRAFQGGAPQGDDLTLLALSRVG